MTQRPLNGYEESVLSLLRELHPNLDLTNFDVIAYVERCLLDSSSRCPLEYGATCKGFEGVKDTNACLCHLCENYSSQMNYCRRFKIDIDVFHRNVRIMLDLDNEEDDDANLEDE
jgi:hypothetical protein